MLVCYKIKKRLQKKLKCTPIILEPPYINPLFDARSKEELSNNIKTIIQQQIDRNLVQNKPLMDEIVTKLDNNGMIFKATVDSLKVAFDKSGFKLGHYSNKSVKIVAEIIASCLTDFNKYFIDSIIITGSADKVPFSNTKYLLSDYINNKDFKNIRNLYNQEFSINISNDSSYYTSSIKEQESALKAKLLCEKCDDYRSDIQNQNLAILRCFYFSSQLFDYKEVKSSYNNIVYHGKFFKDKEGTKYRSISMKVFFDESKFPMPINLSTSL